MAAQVGSSVDLSIPHDKRWPLLKDIIVELFIGQGMSLPKIADHMKTQYSFNAQPAHYRYRLKKWGIHKRTKAEEKDKIIERYAKGHRAGASTSNIVLHKGGIDKKMSEKTKAQLRRHINQQIKQEVASLPLVCPGFILNWNFPYSVLMDVHRHSFDHPSPSSSDAATSPFFTIPSPANAASPPTDAPSPTTQLVRQRASLNQVGLFLQGRQRELLRSMRPEEQKSASIWFHDLFLFSFMTAKYWGRGPLKWNAELIAAKSLGSQPAGTPSHLCPLQSTPSDGLTAQHRPKDNSPPTMLCRWSIHDDDYCDEASDTSSTPADEDQDIEDETTWRPWSDNPGHDLARTIRDGISSNSFTSAESSLSVSPTTVAKVLERSKAELEAESIAFTIIAGNDELLFDILKAQSDALPALGQLYPFHLAATHIRGASSCCLVFDNLMYFLADDISARTHYRNEHGHTILDSLMITILRSHSSVRLAFVCENLGNSERFPGEGVDPCGRWDLDSPCIRRLFASGQTSVPSSWKHPFCHTSAQAVCHSIGLLFSAPWSPDINLPSGIFSRNCGSCGRYLTIKPLHTLVLVAYCLASQGTRGETLFGVIAVLCCMLVHGCNPLDEAQVSVPLLFPIGPANDNCQHPAATPSALANKLAAEAKSRWTSDIQLGWDVFVQILDLAAASRSAHPDSRTTAVECEHVYKSPKNILFFSQGNTYCGSPGLGRLWAAVQAELVTYRRLEEGHSWISANFDLQQLYRGLSCGIDVSYLPLITSGMIGNHTPCGWFIKRRVMTKLDDKLCRLWLTPRAQDVSTSYFMNMEDWSRTTFIPSVADRNCILLEFSGEDMSDDASDEEEDDEDFSAKKEEEDGGDDEDRDEIWADFMDETW